MRIAKYYDMATKNGGVSFKLDGVQPKQGFMVATQISEVLSTDRKQALQQMKKFIEVNNSYLGNNTFIGLYKDGDKILIELSQNITDKTDAIYYGIVRKQVCIYNVKTKELIKVPKGQQTGTSTQQLMYARQIANQF